MSPYTGCISVVREKWGNLLGYAPRFSNSISRMFIRQIKLHKYPYPAVLSDISMWPSLTPF